MFGRRDPAPGSNLHQCAVCSVDYVVPVWWEPADEEHWDVLLRCGQCGTYREVVVPDAAAKAFERALERGMAEIRRQVARMDRDRMADQVEAFIQALRAGLIEPGDFALGLTG